MCAEVLMSKWEVDPEKELNRCREELASYERARKEWAEKALRLRGIRFWWVGGFWLAALLLGMELPVLAFVLLFIGGGIMGLTTSDIEDYETSVSESYGAIGRLRDRVAYWEGQVKNRVRRRR